MNNERLKEANALDDRIKRLKRIIEGLENYPTVKGIQTGTYTSLEGWVPDSILTTISQLSMSALQTKLGELEKQFEEM